jgi:hypothetical protein
MNWKRCGRKWWWSILMCYTDTGLERAHGNLSQHIKFGLLSEIGTCRTGRQPLDRSARWCWNSSRPLLVMESVANDVLVAVNFILSIKLKINGRTVSLLRFLYEHFSYRKTFLCDPWHRSTDFDEHTQCCLTQLFLCVLKRNRTVLFYIRICYSLFYFMYIRRPP